MITEEQQRHSLNFFSSVISSFCFLISLFFTFFSEDLRTTEAFLSLSPVILPKFILSYIIYNIVYHTGWEPWFIWACTSSIFQAWRFLKSFAFATLTRIHSMVTTTSIKFQNEIACLIKDMFKLLRKHIFQSPNFNSSLFIH